ncbi:MAG: methylmalonyl-CoA mutase family protein [Planctomycetota bacterium]|nr:methylmalonyl-CoA mutase family protein [Planctomycetota bacterium]
MSDPQPYACTRPVRFVTAASLFDGHDAAINIMRRILQDTGAEVIHLGHNRSVREVVQTAVEEDAQGIAISSYQGGHNEYFRYVLELLAEQDAAHIQVYGGGGGVIVPEEVEALHAAGVARIFTPEDGRRLGLQGMIDGMLEACDKPPPSTVDTQSSTLPALSTSNARLMAQCLTAAEREGFGRTPLGLALRTAVDAIPPGQRTPVIGVTGTGGAGKSSLVDELCLRFLEGSSDATIAVLSVDPSRRKTGGALLGDRIRMNSLPHPRAYMRSFATRGAQGELSEAIEDAVRFCRLAGFDWIVLETSGIGQAYTEITEHSDLSVYVMTPEYGAASQLEKIGMLDYADLIAVNKFDRRGAEDAVRDVRKQVRRNRKQFDGPDEDLGVFGTVASRFCDRGVDDLFRALATRAAALGGRQPTLRLPPSVGERNGQAPSGPIIPADRAGYLGEIVRSCREYRTWTDQQVTLARDVAHLEGALALVEGDEVRSGVQAALERAQRRQDPRARELLAEWPAIRARYEGEEVVYQVRGHALTARAATTSLAGTRVPKVTLPATDEPGAVLRFLTLENVPGEYPYTAGVFPFKRVDEDPKRQFAGEGTPARTNKRFHYLSSGSQATRLSTAFDSVTLYGEDPHLRPDIYGKIGESGVSICSLADMRILYRGFDLCDRNTSVSMTINGPAPIILAMYLNAAVDQQVEAFQRENSRAPSADEARGIRDRTLMMVRGTVQADILKEDQAQNTCIFSTDFALKMMGDIQEYFIRKKVRNYYSVSISGYHIAEAGANPISQLAFTLANGFTLVEYYLARGMDIDAFAPNLSFFFSNGLDPEYTVIGRVARRIWSVAMANRYGGNSRSQKLKYHVQTSGRSLHAQEIQFNDIRTTLQALLALQDNCNSLHTNAYDEAITTPTEESVRRAMAIQLINTSELGWLKSENPLQGSYFVEHMTDLVEDAVLEEFRRINDRGGVLGAMETQYQRGEIQSQSLYYERRKHDGSLPIIGVNTFLPDDHADMTPQVAELTRATADEKQIQLDHLDAFQLENAASAPEALTRLKAVARAGGNIFEELMTTVRTCSLGQISHALYEVGGKYRRNL